MKDFLSKALELVGCLERVKVDTALADSIKTEMKEGLPDGCHVFGDVVVDIRTQVSTRLNKEALCEFFNCKVEDLEQFMVTTECRLLSAKRAVSKKSA
jgi:hypothetical protein